MHKSKLLKTLKLLKPGELKRLSKFLQSPYYNANGSILECYRYVRKYYPDFESPKLNKEKVFQKLFPERPYDHQKLLNLFSDFTALVEKYLWILQIEKEKTEQEKLLLRALAERENAYAAFVKQFQKINHLLEAFPQKDSAYFLDKFWATQLYFNHSGTDKFKLEGAAYDTSMKQLDQYFVLEKLLLTCEMKAREIPLSEKHEIWLEKELLSENGQPYLQIPIAAAYKEILDLIEQGKEKSYQRLKLIFKENIDKYTRKQQQNILASLLNFAIKKGNQGIAYYVAENLDWYKVGIQQKLLLEENLINDRIYTNIALLASKLHQFDWCLNFIKEYEPYLANQVRSDATAYCLAYWYYGQEKYDAVIDYLNSVNFANDYYQLGARILFLRTYFELFHQDKELYDLLINQTLSFEKYLRRNKTISQEKLNANLDFVLVLRQLIRLGIDRNKEYETRFNLRLKIENKSIAYKSWLLEQIDTI